MHLTQTYQDVILRLVAEYHTPDQCIEFLKTRHNKEVTKRTVMEYYYNSKFKDRILSFREKYLSKLEDTPLAVKRKRLDHLQELYDEAVAEINRNKELDMNPSKAILAAAQVLRDARVEMEGERPILIKQDNYYLHEDLKNKTDAELIQ